MFKGTHLSQKYLIHFPPKSTPLKNLKPQISVSYMLHPPQKKKNKQQKTSPNPKELEILKKVKKVSLESRWDEEHH